MIKSKIALLLSACVSAQGITLEQAWPFENVEQLDDLTDEQLMQKWLKSDFGRKTMGTDLWNSIPTAILALGLGAGAAIGAGMGTGIAFNHGLGWALEKLLGQGSTPNRLNRAIELSIGASFTIAQLILDYQLRQWWKASQSRKLATGLVEQFEERFADLDEEDQENALEAVRGLYEKMPAQSRSAVMTIPSILLMLLFNAMFCKPDPEISWNQGNRDRTLTTVLLFLASLAMHFKFGVNPIPTWFEKFETRTGIGAEWSQSLIFTLLNALKCWFFNDYTVLFTLTPPYFFCAKYLADVRRDATETTGYIRAIADAFQTADEEDESEEEEQGIVIGEFVKEYSKAIEALPESEEIESDIDTEQPQIDSPDLGDSASEELDL